MGTQQILMIVLSVIIVGIAVGVGITMFQNQAVNSNRQAVIADLTNFASQAIAYYKVPATMGGGGNGTPGFREGEGTTPTSGLLSYIGFLSSGGETPTYTYSNDNGTYTLTIAGPENLTITGTGKELLGGSPVAAELTIDMTPDAGQSQYKVTITR